MPGIMSIEDAIGLVQKLDYHSLHSLHSPAAETAFEDGENDSTGDEPGYFLNTDGRPLHYEALHYDEAKKSPPVFVADEEEYKAPAGDTERELLTIEEATATFVDVQYAAVLQSSETVNHEDRRKLQWWIWMNPVEFRLIESVYALTREINYAPMG